MDTPYWTLGGPEAEEDSRVPWKASWPIHLEDTNSHLVGMLPGGASDGGNRWPVVHSMERAAVDVDQDA